MADEKQTTMTPSGELSPLDQRKAMRKQRADDERAMTSNFSHAAELKDIASAEASGERGPEAQARRQSLGTATNETDEDANTAGGEGWGGQDGAGGSPSGEGVTATGSKPVGKPRRRTQQA